MANNNEVAYVTVRCDAQMKDALEELAKADKRPLSNYLRLVLEKHIEDAKTQKKKAA